MNKSTTSVPESLIGCQPYAIVAVFPSRKPKAVGRTRNRSDADAMVRFLARKIPKGTFYVIFDPEESNRTDARGPKTRFLRQSRFSKPMIFCRNRVFLRKS